MLTHLVNLLEVDGKKGDYGALTITTDILC